MTTPSVHFGPDCPDFLRTLVEDALADAEASCNRPLRPGEPDPSKYADFGEYWEACCAYERGAH